MQTKLHECVVILPNRVVMLPDLAYAAHRSEPMANGRFAVAYGMTSRRLLGS